MPAPARYWRVYFRSTSVYDYAHIGFNSLKLYDAAGTHLSASGVTITSQANMLAGYALTNLTDSDDASAAVPNYTGYRTTTTWNSFTFDFGVGNSVLVDHILIRLSGSTYTTNTVIAPETMDFMVDSSTDNITWSRLNMFYSPIKAVATDYRLGLLPTSSYYPGPLRTEVGGGGGIYGIVSEDGVALPNRPVVLIDRVTMSKIGYTTTDANGGYVFNGLNENNEYMVLSYDPSGPPYKNALVWDRIQPINTKSNLTPVSAFWARRTRDSALGGVVSFSNYLNGAVYRFFGGNVLGMESLWFADATLYTGFDWATTTAVGGAIKFLKSNRTASSNGHGLVLHPGAGTAMGKNVSGAVENYSNLTFEFIFKAPETNESSLIFVWGGTRDSDDYPMFGYDNYNGYFMRAVGPTLEVTPTAMNVRFPLGARNRSTVRATSSVVAGAVYHVMIAYEENVELKLYVNGALIQTASLTGAGRLWGHTQITTNFENWDATTAVSGGNRLEATIRRLDHLYIGGTGNAAMTYAINNALWEIPPGWGGAVGFVALYHRKFSATDVTNFYDSYANWETHTITSLKSGYVAEVEADNPALYFRLNEVTRPTYVASMYGSRSYVGTYEAGAVLGATGFVAGSTATTTSNGALYFAYACLSTPITIEMFCRPSSVTGTQRLFLIRRANDIAPLYVSMISGALSLSVTDASGTVTTFTLGQTLVAGQSYHLAIQYDSWVTKKVILYVNGVKISEQQATVIMNMQFQDFLGIGCNPSGTAPTISERFQGELAEVAIYQYILPASRILAHYDARNI